MNSPAEAKTCSRCGAPLTPGTLQGLCPRCLLALNLATQTELTGDDSGQIGGSAVARPEPPTLEELARHFPGLEILELLGRGGMGAVYKVRQKQLDRIVALKILPPRPGDDSAFAERFTREAKALAKLLHPNIVTLFEFGQADGIYYLLMEFVDGVSLGQLLRSSRVSSREALAIVPQICDALQYAHDQGIVHRDIKPENILLDRRGRVKVADFGLAKLVEAKAPLTPALSPSDGERVADRPREGETPVLTKAGKIMGTPNYMAPEQVEHPGEVDHRTDIYALGVVFYQMLTGELPGRRMEPPSKKVQIDVRLDEVVLRALERNPERRYQQVSEVKTCLETIVATPPGSSRREAAQNAGGKAGESLPTSIVRSERARLTVQESADARVNYPAMGEVTLHTDRLVISSGYNQRSIPLADIHALGEAVLPFWVSPGPHRYAAVDFDEAGQGRRLVFLAGTSMFRTPGDTRLHAGEWLTAIQQAVKTGIGGDLPIAYGTIVVPVRTWRSLVWLLVPLAAALPLMASLLSQRDPDSLSVTNAALMSGAFMLIPVLTLSIVFVVRSCSLRGTVKRPLGCATGSAGGPPAQPGVVKGLTQQAAADAPDHDPAMAGQVLRLSDEREVREDLKRQSPAGSRITAQEAREPRARFSRTAVAGCIGILGILALVVYAVIGDSNLLDEGPSNVLAVSGGVCLLLSTFLGWLAVVQIRRSAGNARGMWLAVFNGLLLPLLALDVLLVWEAHTIVSTLNVLPALFAPSGRAPTPNEPFGPQVPHSGIEVLGIISAPHDPFGLLVWATTAFMCVISNTLIARSVWRAAIKGKAGVRPKTAPDSSECGSSSAKPGGALATGAPCEHSRCHNWAFGLFLLGALGSLGLEAMRQQEMAAGFGAVVLAVALSLGLMSWQERLGKVVVMATSALFVPLLVATAVLALVVVPARRARLQADFGPVTECTLPMDEDGWTPLLDLDHNQPVFALKQSATAAKMIQRLAQLKAPGVAVRHDAQAHVISFYGMSGAVVQSTDAHGDQWKKITDMEALASLWEDVEEPGGYDTFDNPDTLPYAIFVKTGAGKLGLLQVTGFTENPRGVKLRYKVIASRASGIGSASSHSTSPQPE
jgi:tRNA A-37 threonylcarbamoyl transferase component Bud32